MKAKAEKGVKCVPGNKRGRNTPLYAQNSHSKDGLRARHEASFSASTVRRKILGAQRIVVTGEASGFTCGQTAGAELTHQAMPSPLLGPQRNDQNMPQRWQHL